MWMPTARESVCCREISKIENKMSELQTLDPSSEGRDVRVVTGYPD